MGGRIIPALIWGAGFLPAPSPAEGLPIRPEARLEGNMGRSLSVDSSSLNSYVQNKIIFESNDNVVLLLRYSFVFWGWLDSSFFS